MAKQWHTEVGCLSVSAAPSELDHIFAFTQGSAALHPPRRTEVYRHFVARIAFLESTRSHNTTL